MGRGVPELTTVLWPAADTHTYALAVPPGNLDGTGSHIYVLDTGVRWSHIDFSGRVGTSTSVISRWARVAVSTCVGVGTSYLTGTTSNMYMPFIHLKRLAFNCALLVMQLLLG
jgi:hypothetical protein